MNTIGTYNAIASAVENGHRRFINTGPHFTSIGWLYEDFDFDVSPDGKFRESLISLAMSPSF